MKKDPYKNISDEEVVALALKDGENDVFRELYTRYKTKVINKCYSMVKNKEEAEELAQEVFARVVEKLSTYKGSSSFSSWIYSVTYNHCIDYLRTQKKMHYPEWNKDNEIPEIIDEIDENEIELNYDRLMLILEKVHPEEKALLLMKYQDNIPIKQIAEAMKITESATKMRLKRARTRVMYLYKKLYKD